MQPSPSEPVDNRPRIPVNVEASLQPGPDGQPWAKVQIAVGLNTFSMLVPEATAEDLAKVLESALMQAAAAVRRTRLGIVLPSMAGEGAMQLPINGVRPT